MTRGNLNLMRHSTAPDERPVLVEPLHPDAQIADDLTLVQRLLVRDEAAWLEFVTRFDRLIQSRIDATCREVGMTTDLANVVTEVSAEVYAALVDRDMESLRNFSGRSRLSTWLSVVVRRIALRHVSRRRRLPVSAQPEQCSQLVERTPESDGAEKLAEIKAARHQLSSSDQRVLRLFYDDGRTYEQIAEVLEISANAVGPKLYRARRRLRKILERPPYN